MSRNGLLPAATAGTRRTARQLATIAFLAGSAAAAATANATDKPLWEFGLGAGALLFNDYRGSDTSSVYPIPVPYFVYRGKFLRADREGLRGLLFNQRFAELNVSVNATTPVRSRDIAARRGMPDLKPTVEVGPSLDLHLWRSPDRRLRLNLGLPARAAFTVEASPRHVGWFFAPRLNLDVAGVAGRPGWNLGLLAGPLFADRGYNEYFYSVAPAFAAPGRPAYRARAGYAGTQAIAALSKRFPGYWVGAFVRYDTLAGATFVDSPLVRRNGYLAAGFGIAWMISESRRLVAIDD
jgi:outer membrane protein